MQTNILKKGVMKNKGDGIILIVLSVVLSAVMGCGSGKATKKQDDFFTSGSREADQRATQRMAKEQQVAGGGQGQDSKATKGSNGVPAQAPGKLPLFDRLGGEQGINAIVDDFTARALEDPRVNWQRKGVKRGGLLGRDDSVAWTATPTNTATLKKHFVQFLSLATGGPPRYDGKEMKSAHAGMRISNPEFDATVGDLKASLDKLRVPDKEQKELLAIIESTRPQIVTER
jgi:hemoglobin